MRNLLARLADDAEFRTSRPLHVAYSFCKAYFFFFLFIYLCSFHSWFCYFLLSVFCGLLFRRWLGHLASKKLFFFIVILPLREENNEFFCVFQPVRLISHRLQYLTHFSELRKEQTSRVQWAAAPEKHSSVQKSSECQRTCQVKAGRAATSSFCRPKIL